MTMPIRAGTSRALRIAALGGIAGGLAWLPTSFLARSTAHVLDTSAPRRALAELGAHPDAAFWNAFFYALTDLGFILLACGLVIAASGRRRAAVALGGGLLAISSILDLLAE